MANYGILIKSRVAAKNVDSWNRSAVTVGATAGSNVDNGNVFRLDSQSTVSGWGEVWSVTVPTTNGSTMNSLWMAASPEVNVTIDGALQYRGLNADPRRFTNVAGSAFDAIKLQVGDVIMVSSDAISGSPSTGLFVQPTNGSVLLAWSATQTASTFCAKQLQETYISIGTGGLGDSQRVLAYKLQVIAN